MKVRFLGSSKQEALQKAASTLEKMSRDGNRNFPCREVIESGLCKADCCLNHRLERPVWEQNEAFARVKPTSIILSRVYALILTDDGKCVFLDRETLECTIFERRALKCKLFGIVERDGMQCPWLNSKGEKRPRAIRRRIQQKNERAHLHNLRIYENEGLEGDRR